VNDVLFFNSILADEKAMKVDQNVLHFYFILRFIVRASVGFEMTNK